MEPLTYSWLKDGQRLSFINLKQPILQLTAVQAADAGLYSCIVSNADGVILSREAALLVAEHQADCCSQAGGLQSASLTEVLCEVIMQGG